MSCFRRIATVVVFSLLPPLAMAEPAVLAKRPVARPAALVAPALAPRPPSRPDGLASAACDAGYAARDGPGHGADCIGG